jgi:hypothetical protein
MKAGGLRGGCNPPMKEYTSYFIIKLRHYVWVFIRYSIGDYEKLSMKAGSLRNA